MSDAEFDILVGDVFLAATRRKWAHILEADDLPELDFSPRYLRWRKKFLSDPFAYVRRKTRPLWKKTLQTAACLLLCAGMAFGGLMVFSPQARAWAARFVTPWRETHTIYTFTGEPRPGDDVGVWRPEYVPEGFEETFQMTEPALGHVLYENADGLDIRFFYMPMEQGGAFSNDNEHSDYSKITVAACPADLYVSNTEGKSSHLIWFDEAGGIAYKLSSKLNYRELISMAESVKKIN